MAFNPAEPYNILTILQIVVTAAAAIGAIVTAIRFIEKRMDHKIDERIEPKLAIICKDVTEIRHKVGLMEQSLEFFEKYFLEPVRLKSQKKKKIHENNNNGGDTEDNEN